MERLIWRHVDTILEYLDGTIFYRVALCSAWRSPFSGACRGAAQEGLSMGESDAEKRYKSTTQEWVGEAQSINTLTAFWRT
jgi:hypothetical protein